MAQKPISKVLPADLPADWTNDQYISSDGQEVGLTTQHGYNYLNEQINETQEEVNAINEAFEDLATIDYVDTEIASITGIDTSIVQHVNDPIIHTTAAEKAKWNTVGTVANLNTNVKTDTVSAINELASCCGAGMVMSIYTGGANFKLNNQTITNSISLSAIASSSTSTIANTLIPGTDITLVNPFGDVMRTAYVSVNIWTSGSSTSNTTFILSDGFTITSSTTGTVTGTKAFFAHPQSSGNNDQILLAGDFSGNGNIKISVLFNASGSGSNSAISVYGFSMIVGQIRI